MVSFQPSKKQSPVLCFINLIFELLKIQKTILVGLRYWMSIDWWREHRIGGLEEGEGRSANGHPCKLLLYVTFLLGRRRCPTLIFQALFFNSLCHSRSFFFFFFLVMYRLMWVVLSFIFLRIFAEISHFI